MTNHCDYDSLLGKSKLNNGTTQVSPMPDDDLRFEETGDELRDDEFPDDDGDDDYDDDNYDDGPAETLPCGQCGAEIYEDAVRCPACGAYVTHNASIWSGRPPWWILLGILAAILALAGLIGW
ncbi:MAG: hypothetical protein A2V70_04460 [Planctomycetes bacterium RBG_13_63_9]|nr:MAG: hypothetical protein A2V70_04460 [Planctomycetes bacterium RBG_13_63_9]